MCDRPWAEVHAELKAAGLKPSRDEIDAHINEIAEVFQHWHDVWVLATS